MKIKDIISYLEEHKLTNTVADEFVKSGYGQTIGGYLKNKEYRPSQFEHFVNYYSKRPYSIPTFSNLWCPELMLFIAESLGINRRYIEEASKIVISYEEKNNLKNEKKCATYLPRHILTDFKKTLKLYELCSILKENDDWNTIRKKISNL